MENYKNKMIYFIHQNSIWQASKFLPKITIQLYIKWFLISIVSIAILSYFFYRSTWAFLVLSPAILPLSMMQRELWKAEVRTSIETDFKEWLLHVRSELGAGYSVEHAIIRSKKNLEKLLPTNSYVWIGLEEVNKALVLHVSVDQVILQYGLESQCVAIMEFATMYRIAKKQGYQMSKVLDQTISVICERIMLQFEVDCIIKGKELEQRIMCIIPFFILVYVGQMGGGYFDILYHNLMGVCIMTGCLVVYCASVCWGIYIIKSGKRN